VGHSVLPPAAPSAAGLCISTRPAAARMAPSGASRATTRQDLPRVLDKTYLPVGYEVVILRV